MWACDCDCGGSTLVNGTALRNGAVKSCGCLKRIAAQRAGAANISHGMTMTRTWKIWSGMKRRCNPTNRYAKYHAGRGITVCDRWRVFENFLEDMGEAPEGLEIDRIDNDGNYEPGNCRWVTRSVNSLNRRTSLRNRSA